MRQTQIKPTDRKQIIRALKQGITPKKNIKYITVGRTHENVAMTDDIKLISAGGSSVRFILGDYGAGKTFFLTLAREMAHQDTTNLVTMSADITPNRKLNARDGTARLLYSELIQSMSIRTSARGNALVKILGKFMNKLAQEDGSDHDLSNRIHETLEPMANMTLGFEFIAVLQKYWQGYDQGDDALKANALRWLRGEYTSKMDAKKDLGVRYIIDDQNIYDCLKLIGKFCEINGYKGLLVCLDEAGNLCKIASSQSRNSNFQVILNIINDVTQGTAENIGFLFGGVPEFLADPKRGLYSDPALRTRLAENEFARDGLIDTMSPVIRLTPLTENDFYQLLKKITEIYFAEPDIPFTVTEENYRDFMAYSFQKLGANYFQTPRGVIKSFVNILTLLHQNPTESWDTIMHGQEIKKEERPDDIFGDMPLPEESPLQDFKLTSAS